MSARGKCMVAWKVCTRPKELEGLGITDLKLTAMAFEAKWLWLQKVDAERAWANLAIKQFVEAMAFFRASTYTIVGNGQNTLFWQDSWINGVSFRTMARTLLNFISKRAIRQMTVATALMNRAWVRSISVGISIPAIAEYLQLWHAINDIVLNDTSDKII